LKTAFEFSFIKSLLNFLGIFLLMDQNVEEAFSTSESQDVHSLEAIEKWRLERKKNKFEVRKRIS